jgi:hypothetical protein
MKVQALANTFQNQNVILWFYGSSCANQEAEHGCDLEQDLQFSRSFIFSMLSSIKRQPIKLVRTPIFKPYCSQPLICLGTTKINIKIILYLEFWEDRFPFCFCASLCLGILAEAATSLNLQYRTLATSSVL